MKYRHCALALLAALSVITYLDRVCISVAGPRIQNELHLSPQDWGLVTGAFAVAYALFEIPSGYLADRFGARAMLTRIVLWWSVFTTLTGFAFKLWPLMIIRFFFGAGEAGAYPTASTSVFRWFPVDERGRAFGVIFLSSQLGGAIAPLLIVPIQVHFGWRVSFYVFGILGVVWAGGWWRWYRNLPEEKPGITDRELAEIGQPADMPPHAFPWEAIGANKSVWAIMGATFAYLYSYYFFLFWLPTYMMRARGFTEGETKLSALPFLLGALANIVGGYARDAAVLRYGPKWGPRAVCMAGLVIASASAFAALISVNKYAALAWLALCYGGITFQQPTVWATASTSGGGTPGQSQVA
jgi:MFS family permease